MTEQRVPAIRVRDCNGPPLRPGIGARLPPIRPYFRVVMPSPAWVGREPSAKDSANLLLKGLGLS